MSMNMSMPKREQMNFVGDVNMTKLYKNWTVHNILSHPLSQIAYLLGFPEKVYNWIHDVTLPQPQPETET